MGDLQGLPEKKGTVFIIDSYTRFQESEKRLEEAEGNREQIVHRDMRPEGGKRCSSSYTL